MMDKATGAKLSQAMTRIRTNVERAIDRLQSLQEGDIGVIDVIAQGADALPYLKALLFKPEPSGLYESRRRAVEALAALWAYDTLREFLASPREIADPAEQTGEEAVINAAARALGNLGDPQDLPLLLALLRRAPRAGVIDAVGRFRRVEALPFFVEALGDDFCRKDAQAAILKLGAKARHALFQCLLEREPPNGREVDSSKQRRRSALRLLIEIGVPSKLIWTPLKRLIHDADTWISVLSCKVCLASKMESEKPEAIERLIQMLKEPDSLLIAEIEDSLDANFQRALPAINHAIEYEVSMDDPGAPWWLKDKALTVLLRIRSKHAAAPTPEENGHYRGRKIN